VIHGHRRSCRNRLCNSVRNTRCDIVFHSDRFPVLLNEAGGLRCPEPTALRARGSIPDRQLGGARVHRSWGLRPQPQASPSASERRIQRASFETCVAASIADDPLLGSTTACMLRYWVALWTEDKRLHTYRWAAETRCAGASAASLVLGQWRRGPSKRRSMTPRGCQIEDRRRPFWADAETRAVRDVGRS